MARGSKVYSCGTSTIESSKLRSTLAPDKPLKKAAPPLQVKNPNLNSPSIIWSALWVNHPLMESTQLCRSRFSKTAGLKMSNMSSRSLRNLKSQKFLKKSLKSLRRNPRNHRNKIKHLKMGKRVKRRKIPRRKPKDWVQWEVPLLF